MAASAPIVEHVRPGDLLWDETYQRELTPRSEALIRRIVERWDWLKFKAPVVALTDAGIDASDYSVPVRALPDAKPARCRYPFGPMQDFTYCSAKATVKAAGARAYCDECAKRMGFDLQAWQRAQDAMTILHGGKP